MDNERTGVKKSYLFDQVLTSDYQQEDVYQSCKIQQYVKHVVDVRLLTYRVIMRPFSHMDKQVQAKHTLWKGTLTQNRESLIYQISKVWALYHELSMSCSLV